MQIRHCLEFFALLRILPAFIFLPAYVRAGDATASASISALATVAQPVGMLSGSDIISDSEFVLYCPDGGHVFYSIAYREHLRQIDGSIADCSFQLRHQSLLCGEIVSRVTIAGLRQTLPVDSDTCVMTLIYTEN